VATAVAIAVDLDGEDLRVDDALGDLYASASLSAEELAAERGIERVRAAADRYLFVAGLEEDDDGADSALDFAARFARRVTEFAAQEEISVDLQIGLSTGYVETGLMTRGNLSFTAWGEPVRSAMIIGSLSESTVVGVDATTVEVADPDRWTFSPAPPMRGLEDQPLDIYSLTLDDDSPDPTDTADDDTT
jgi:class 3 adenylate cyclase